MRHLLTVLCIGVLAAGCGDSSSTASAGGSTSSNSTGSGGSGGSASDIPVVFNEVQATNSDYVELMNMGTSVFDFSGYAIADSATTGEPKLTEAARMPPGTSLAPGSYLLLVAEQDPAAGVGPHDMCLPMGPSSCYYSTWGISAANGETLFLLAPDDSIVSQIQYPMNVAPAGSSYGRLPDGTGDFTVTALTPGQANTAP